MNLTGWVHIITVNGQETVCFSLQRKMLNTAIATCMRACMETEVNAEQSATSKLCKLAS